MIAKGDLPQNCSTCPASDVVTLKTSMLLLQYSCVSNMHIEIDLMIVEFEIESPHVTPSNIVLKIR